MNFLTVFCLRNMGTTVSPLGSIPGCHYPPRGSSVLISDPDDADGWREYIVIYHETDAREGQQVVRVIVKESPP